MTHDHARHTRNRVTITQQSGRRSRRRLAAAAVAATLVVVATIAACTPEHVQQAAAHLGQPVDAATAQQVADAYNAQHPGQPQLDPAADVTPDMARAIAWTAAVADYEARLRAEADRLLPPGTTYAMWARVRHCESGASGGYRAVSASGTFRGAYQMNADFWRSYGGDPTYLRPPSWERAPEAMQDAVAFRGYAARGRQPWTSGGPCGYALPARSSR